ncbi:hypothetical protein [Burkholderia stagnalis]|uniref:hypothetical protein n=1 Tax=Burkholderia stagnalis TaxID=1503054 RepID=UPI000759B51E|nr:hypothetical protein [Burkholderia stagnalis]KVL97451.1 hypothetical protein WT03_10390 [Burkholderia stagnalis]KVM00222.1 hypothetical protein WT02_07905 [Burkholderia stagnalis]KVM04590.1 hypothetical protein WT04_26045 [Burkholderia stagnalis]
MHHFSALKLLVMLVIIAICIYPYVRIVRRIGHSGWWVLTMAVPILNFIMLWVFAFVRWPAVDDQRG